MNRLIEQLPTFLCLLLWSVETALGTGTALTFEIPDNENFCFAEKFRDSKSRILEYRVIRGGNQDIDVTITSPNGKILYKERKSADSVTFDTSFGEFKICFGNEFSTFTHKLVYFDLRKTELDNLAVEAGDKKPFVKTALEMAFENIHEIMTLLVDYQKDYRLREMTGRHVAETVNIGVSWWSVGQTIVVVITGFGQVLILKTFFTDYRQTSQL